MDDNTYMCMYPTGVSSPKFSSLPKSTKRTYGLAKELLGILKPLVGNTPQHIHKDMTLRTGSA